LNQPEAVKVVILQLVVLFLPDRLEDVVAALLRGIQGPELPQEAQEIRHRHPHLKAIAEEVIPDRAVGLLLAAAVH
jgi:hypothetical protein